MLNNQINVLKLMLNIKITETESKILQKGTEFRDSRLIKSINVANMCWKL